jgi:hypothetical protein
MNQREGNIRLPQLHLPQGLSQFTSRLMSWQDVEAVLKFRQQIFTTLPKAFRVTDPDLDDVASAEMAWARQHLCEPGVTLGVFHQSEMIAFASLTFPQKGASDKIGTLMGLSDAQAARSAHLAACMVAEGFRGLRLQPKLINWRRDLATQAGRTFIVSMTACGNHHSLRNMMDAGLSIRWVGEMAPGRWWQALAMDLETGTDAPKLVNPVWIKGEDYLQQAALTRQGFEGVAEIIRPGLNGKLCAHLEFAEREVMAASPGDTNDAWSRPNKNG